MVTVCGHLVGHVDPAPPASIVVDTPCGTYAVDVRGTIERSVIPPAAPPWAPRAVGHPSTGVWIAHPRGRLAVYRNGRLLWRSRILTDSDNVAVRGNRIAFTVYADRGGFSTWLARVGGRERRIARDEAVLGWTRRGILVTQDRGSIVAHGPDGARYRELASMKTAAYDPSSGTVVLQTGTGLVQRTDGVHVKTLVQLSKLGLVRQPWLYLLRGGILQISARDRTVFLNSDGSRFASFAFAHPTEWIVGEALPLRNGRGIVFAGDYWPKHGSKVETVYVLDRGAHTTRRVFSHRLFVETCGQWADLDERQGSVLYASSDGALAVIDPASERVQNLRGLVRRLSHRRQWTPDDRLRAAWLDR